MVSRLVLAVATRMELMNSSRFQDDSLRPTYMSQTEANDLMELWAERQREEAARHSLITVHDVAEATQLSVQDVERLLQEVRAGRGATVQPTRALSCPVFACKHRQAYPKGGLSPIGTSHRRICFLHGGVPNELSESHPLFRSEFRGWGPPGYVLCAMMFYAFVVSVATVYESCRRWLESRILKRDMSGNGRSDSYGIR